MSDNIFETHGTFIHETVLPLLKQQAREQQADGVEVAVVVFCAMATVLHFEGFSVEQMTEMVVAAGANVPEMRTELLQ